MVYSTRRGRSKFNHELAKKESWVLWASRDGKLQNYDLLIRGANVEKMKIDKRNELGKVLMQCYMH